MVLSLPTRGEWMECPDGLERKCFPLLAMHVVDHKEALKATCTKKTTCTGCAATEGQLQNLYQTTFEKKKTSQMKQLYETKKKTVLDSDDHPLERRIEMLKRIEQEYFGCRSSPLTPHPTYPPFTFNLTVWFTVTLPGS